MTLAAMTLLLSLQRCALAQFPNKAKTVLYKKLAYTVLSTK
jgi:hypothetical protein